MLIRIMEEKNDVYQNTISQIDRLTGIIDKEIRKK
jgi:hypothetical protein